MNLRILALAMLLGMPPVAATAHDMDQVLDNPAIPRAQVAANTRWGQFAIVVSPNLVEYARASAAALAESARYCQSIGKTAPAKFGYVRRYSNYVLDGWEFGGKCD